MALSDAVLGNLTTIYVAVIVAIKAYGLVIDRSFGAGFVLAASTAVVGVMFVGTLAWDVSRRAAAAVSRYNREISSRGGGREYIGCHDEMCKGGICWHGVGVRSLASQVRFRLPQNFAYGSL